MRAIFLRYACRRASSAAQSTSSGSNSRGFFRPKSSCCTCRPRLSSFSAPFAQSGPKGFLVETPEPTTRVIGRQSSNRTRTITTNARRGIDAGRRILRRGGTEVGMSYVPRSPRRATRLRAVVDDGAHHAVGPVRDMSTSGLFVEAAAPLVVGTRVAVVPLIGELDGERLPAEVARVAERGLALRFLGLDPEVRQSLRRTFSDEPALHLVPKPRSISQEG